MTALAIRDEYPNADVVDAIDFHEWRSVSEIAVTLGATTAEVKREIDRLMKRDPSPIERKGSGRSALYRLVP